MNEFLLHSRRHHHDLILAPLATRHQDHLHGQRQQRAADKPTDVLVAAKTYDSGDQHNTDDSQEVQGEAKHDLGAVTAAIFVLFHRLQDTRR